MEAVAPAINTASVTRLSDGRVQFAFSAPGATQATVWAATNFSPGNWQSLGTVPLNGGNGLFTDANAPGFRYRFYRVTVP